MKFLSEHYRKQKKMHKECKRMIRMISMGEEFKIDIGTKSRGKKLYQSCFWKQERNNTLKSRKT